MAAQVTGNTAEVARIQGKMTPQEATATAQFMSTVIGQCGGLCRGHKACKINALCDETSG